MGDENTLNAAADTAKNTFKDAKDAAANFANELYEKLGPAISRQVKLMMDLGSGASEIGKQFMSAKDTNIELTKSFQNLSLAASQGMALFAKKDLFSGFAKNATNSFATVDDQYKDLINSFGGDHSKAFAFLKTSNIIPTEVFNKGTAAVAAFIDKAGNVQKLQQAFVGMQSSVGGMNEVFANMSDIQGTLSKKTLEFQNRIQSAAEATNLLPNAVATAASALGTSLPGAFQETISSSDKSTSSMDLLTAALRTAAGTGRQNSEVIEVLNGAYENLSNAQGIVTDSGSKGLKMFSLMSQASNDLNIRFADTKGFLDDVSKQFKFIGDNTEGATKVLYTYIDALRNTGLTTKASTEIINGMIDSVTKLSTGTKALLSAHSGGPGGLQGSFQIEKLIREGKTDEVIKMMESSLRKQFGGRIYTLQDAAASQEGAGQFMRQRQMLNSGVFGNLTGGDENKATKLLEAMASGGKFAKEPGTSQSILDETLKKGNAVQQIGNTELAKLNGGINRQIIIGETSIGLLAKLSGTADKELEDFRKQAEGKMGEQVSEVTDNSLGDLALQAGRQTIEGATSATKNALSTVGNSLGKISENMFDAGKAVIEFAGKKAEEKKYINRQENTSRALVRGMPTEKDAVAAGLTLPGMKASVAPAVKAAQAIQKVQVESKPADVNLNLKITAPDGFGVEADSDGNHPMTTSNIAGMGIGVSVPIAGGSR